MADSLADQLTDLPDPMDRTLAWWNGQPAYRAWWERLIELQNDHRFWDQVGRLERSYAHAIPSMEALDQLVELGPLLEIGAGAGYWARLLSDHGGNIVATEPESPGDNAWIDGTQEPWTRVVHRGIDAVSDFPDRIVFVCMPPRPSGFMPKLLRRAPHPVLAIVSDGEGCFGPDEMYTILRREWTQTSELPLPNFPLRLHKLMLWRNGR